MKNHQNQECEAVAVFSEPIGSYARRPAWGRRASRRRLKRWQIQQERRQRLARHAANAASDGPVLVRLADVKAENVSWLWPGRVAKGKLNLLVGDPGTGKTFVALDIAARLSTGKGWPDGGIAPKTATLVMTAEDGLADTIRPRLDALGADIGEIHALEAVRASGEERAFSFDEDCPALSDAIQATGAGLVIVDPLSAYLGKGDSFKDAEVRRVLGPLARLAELAGVAILGIVHLTKDAERRAVSRVQGSIGIVAAARVVMAVAKDKKLESRRLLLPIKNNLTKPAPTLAFSMDESGCLVWEDSPVGNVDVEAAMSGSPPPSSRGNEEEASKIEIATQFLRLVLAGGSKPQEEVKRLATEKGIAERTLWRAKDNLQVDSVRAGSFDHREAWHWCLPGYEVIAAQPTNGSVHEPTLGVDLENDGTIGESRSAQPCQLAQSCQLEPEAGTDIEAAGAHDIGPPVTPEVTAVPEAESLV